MTERYEYRNSKLHFSFSDRRSGTIQNRYSKDEGYIINLHIGHGSSMWYTVAWSDKHTREHYDFELDLITR